jgi:hypothetical protein
MSSKPFKRTENPGSRARRVERRAEERRDAKIPWQDVRAAQQALEKGAKKANKKP